MYKNMADQYDEALKKIQYGGSYDIRIHSVQTSFSLLGYNDNDDVNKNSIIYGYYDVNTENMILQFQKDNNIIPTGILDEKTWELLFNQVAVKTGLAILETGYKEISLVDIDSYTEELIEEQNIHPNLDSETTLQFNTVYKESDSKKTHPNFIYSIQDVELEGIYNGDRYHPNLDSGEKTLTNNYWYDPTHGVGQITSTWMGNHFLTGGEMYDILMYNYLVNGNKTLGQFNYTNNLDNTPEWHDSKIHPNSSASAEKDYNFIYNLLANSISTKHYYKGQPLKTAAATTGKIGEYNGGFENSNNKPFFSPDNINNLKKSKFDITIVYGATGDKARKIRHVVPIAVSQELNASGEPIYDVYEFVARDVSYSEIPRG